MTDTDDFGSMPTATNSNCTDDNDVLSLREKILHLEKREQELTKERKEGEAVFGQNRARFKELFLQKEEELKSERDKRVESEDKHVSIETKLKSVNLELEDLKTVATISELAKQDEIDEIREHFQEELASVQRIMKEAADDMVTTRTSEYEMERQLLSKSNEKLDQELQELKNKLNQDREGILAAVAKSIKRVGGGTSSANVNSESDNLEDGMRRAQEDAEMLRSVILPLEEELIALKEKLRASDSRVQELEAKEDTKDLSLLTGDGKKSPSLPDLDSNKDPEDRVKEVMQYLKVEKSARMDLEMYVSVLNTQRNVLQDEMDKSRIELQEVCRLLEGERKEHGDLMRTWTMANDQFLESQRLMMMDMRRMETVLTAEQQRQIAELQKKDQERETQERRVKALEELREREQKEQDAKKKREELKTQTGLTPEKYRLNESSLSKSQSASNASLLSNTSADDLFAFDNSFNELSVKKSFSSSHLSNMANEEELVDSGVHETRSLHETDTIRISPEKTLNLQPLSEAQQKSLTDPTPESEARKSLLASVRSKVEGISLEGKRLVSEKEWALLQKETKAAREKLGRPCDMCHNYEAQLQTVQEQFKDVQQTNRSLERQLESEKQVAVNNRKYRESLESNLKEVTEDAQMQISTLTTKVHESEKYMASIKQQFNQSQLDMQDQLKVLTDTREEVQREIARIEKENDSLQGLHSKHSQQLQNEDISLPNNLEEMQLLLLRYREDIISAKVAKEHTESTLKSEILFLKHQVVGEQQEKTTVEETLTQEISQLQEQLAVQDSVKSELEREATVRAETESKLRESEQTLKNLHAKTKQIMNALQQQLEEHNNNKARLEYDNGSLKVQIQSLTVDLDNSEAVQRDFVKLSQSLQIQLEKIRQAETEVRWQYEDDVDDCNTCNQQFTVTKRKHHCRHCGRIFCSDCVTKSVNSGPHFRLSKVCDVCHTILVKDATPYFSTEPPSTPH